MSNLKTRTELENIFQFFGPRFTSVTATKKNGESATYVVNSHYKPLAKNPSEAAIKAAKTRRENNPDLINFYCHKRKHYISLRVGAITEIKQGNLVYRPDQVYHL